jgi:hypothetical protein
MYRINKKGRYLYECSTCGVYIKTNARFCIGCTCDLLGSREPGTWKADLAKERKDRRDLLPMLPQVDGIPAMVI